MKNYSFHPTRRIDLAIGIDYVDDVDKALQTARTVATADLRILKDPSPMVVVGNLGESSVDLIVRVWCNAADYWDVKFDLAKALKLGFAANGLTIPFPQRTIYMMTAEK